LIHASGMGVYKKISDIDYREWKLSFDINVNSVFLVIQKLLPLLFKAQQSHVIVTGSGMGKIAVAGRSAYCASKFALRGLMLSLAKEYRDSNIHFNLLTLGSVLTAFGQLTIEEKKEKEERGKKYIKPAYLAHTLVNRLKNDSLEEENPIYPKDYFRQSIKGKS